jgi:hypothetical protein
MGQETQGGALPAAVVSGNSSLAPGSPYPKSPGSLLKIVETDHTGALGMEASNCLGWNTTYIKTKCTILDFLSSLCSIATV